MCEYFKEQPLTAVGLKRKMIGWLYGARSLFRDAAPRQRQIENIKLRIKRDSLKDEKNNINKQKQ